MAAEIALFYPTFKKLEEYFDSEKILESGAFLLSKISSNKSTKRFIGHTLIIPEDGDYLQRTQFLIIFHPRFIKQIIERCIDEQYHIIDFHKHPFSVKETMFSGIDNDSHLKIIGPYLNKYVRNLEWASVVVGESFASLDARVYSKWVKTSILIKRVKIIGVDHMSIIPTTSNTNGNGKRLFNSEICNRTILALGSRAQQIFSTLKIGLVGAGGLGSVLGELLSRLPVHTIIPVDFDIVQKSNLNRLTNATMRDAQYKRSKVDVLERGLKQNNTQIKVIPLKDDLLNPGSQQILKSCDIVFGCTDSISSRLATNRLALAHAIPYFDLGSGAKVESGMLARAGGQIIKVVPYGNFCLHCANYFPKDNLSLELMSDKERAASQQLNYLSGDIAPQDMTPSPSIYAINMQTASWAEWLMMNYVSNNPIRIDGIGIDAANFTVKPWTHSEGTNKDCPICGEHGIVGLADEVPFLTRSSKVQVPLPPRREAINYDKVQSVHNYTDFAASLNNLGQKIDWIV